MPCDPRRPPRPGTRVSARGRSSGPGSSGPRVVALGGGRLRSDQEIDPAVGLSDIVELGATVQAGQPLMRIHARTEADAATAMQRLREAVRIENEMTQPLPPLVWQRIGAGDAK